MDLAEKQRTKLPLWPLQSCALLAFLWTPYFCALCFIRVCLLLDMQVHIQFSFFFLFSFFYKHWTHSKNMVSWLRKSKSHGWSRDQLTNFWLQLPHLADTWQWPSDFETLLLPLYNVAEGRWSKISYSYVRRDVMTMWPLAQSPWHRKALNGSHQNCYY
jgi:hypothetical protein